MPAIIAGKRKGAKLDVPTGLGVRPTLSRVRAALFSMILSELQTLQRCRVLDPFAGAGLLGLEAWSRGAEHVDFMEQSRDHFATLKKNVDKLHAQNDVCLKLGQSPRDWRLFAHKPYDLVLCDPPYADNLMPLTLKTLHDDNWIHQETIISVETAAQEVLQIPDAFICFKERIYGNCKISLLKCQPARQNERL